MKFTIVFAISVVAVAAGLAEALTCVCIPNVPLPATSRACSGSSAGSYNGLHNTCDNVTEGAVHSFISSCRGMGYDGFCL